MNTSFSGKSAKRTMLGLAAFTLVLAVAGCGTMDQQSNMVAFTTQLRGTNEVPQNSSVGTGNVDAVLDKKTNLLRWKVSYSGLSGPATGAHFHGPALVGANGPVVLPWKSPIASPLEGSATLTAVQADDLIAGKWYANIHTAANPGGEIRGQMTARY